MSRVVDVPTLRLHPEQAPRVADARDALLAWTRNPVPLRRPVVLYTGFLMPPFMLDAFLHTLQACATDTEGRIIRMSCHPLVSLRSLGRRFAERAERLYARGDGSIDVIGHSMGGIVTREAARAHNGLRVQRLFALASPHRGAGFLAPITPHPHAQSLRIGSTYLDELNADPSSSDFDIHTFRLHHDLLISARSAHAVGRTHYDWTPELPLVPTHSQAQWDLRIRAAVIGMLLGHLQPHSESRPVQGRQSRCTVGSAHE